jgi:hypothetical protein
MGWVDPVESYASPPRLSDAAPGEAWTGEFDDPGDSRWEIAHTSVPASVLSLDGCDTLDIENSTFDGVTFVGPYMPRISALRTTLVQCDLSGQRFAALRNVRFVDCKLVGADFSGSDLLDVSFERCVLSLTNFRMVKLRRVQFTGCTLHDVDAYDLDAEDVGFAGSDLERVNMDRLRARRVDLRGTRRLGLEHFGALNGCLITRDQVIELTYPLAFAAGLDIERDIDPDESRVDARR